MAELRKLGLLRPSNAVLFVCDIQTQFEKSIELFDMVVTNAERLIKACNIFKIPVVVTEQYPKVRFQSESSYL